MGPTCIEAGSKAVVEFSSLPVAVIPEILNVTKEEDTLSREASEAITRKVAFLFSGIEAKVFEIDSDNR